MDSNIEVEWPNRPKPLTVKQLIDLLYLCESDDAVKFVELSEDADECRSVYIAFVENAINDGIVYLYTKKPNFSNEIITTQTKVLTETEAFARTRWIDNEQK